MPIQLSLSQDTVYTGSDKNISVTVRVDPYQELKAIIIRKGNQFLKQYKTIPAKEVKNDGTYQFKTEVSDNENYSFAALGKDDKEYDSHMLFVDNRTGIFPISVDLIARETGKSLQNDFSSLNPNNTDINYNIGGTDLGIMWQMSGDRVGLIFGDTFGSDFTPSTNGGGNGSNWRSNVMAISDNNDLTKGLVFSGMITENNHPRVAREIIHSDHITNGSGSYTAIPTAAVHVNNTDFVHYMDVRQWGEPGRWTTNFSSLYASTENGQTWSSHPEIMFSPNSNFAQAAYAKKDGYVYMMGTVPGRYGAAYVCRFTETDILNQPAYEYWNNVSGWVKGDEQAATPLFGPQVGELSLLYNYKFGKWMVTYLDENANAIVIRSAGDITGPWSQENILVSSSADNNRFSGLYGGFMYPRSNESDTLYFNMSLWYPYNVFLLKAVLKDVE